MNIRLDSTLVLDDEKEKDIIDSMQAMKMNHTSGKFITALIRVAFDNPEIFKECINSTTDAHSILEKLTGTQELSIREAYFKKLNDKTADTKKKVDDIYDMAMKMYILSQMGKELNLEDKSSNLLLASFILEKQVKELEDIVGSPLKSDQFASNKLADKKKFADDTLEYIIETYSGIYEELKGKFSIKEVEIPTTQVVVKEQEVKPEPVVHPIVKPVVTKAKPVEVVEQSTESADTDDEIVDFGNADIDALSNFFNEG